MGVKCAACRDPPPRRHALRTHLVLLVILVRVGGAILILLAVAFLLRVLSLLACLIAVLRATVLLFICIKTFRVLHPTLEVKPRGKS